MTVYVDIELWVRQVDELFCVRNTSHDGGSRMRGRNGVNAETPDPGVIRVGRLPWHDCATSLVNPVID